jgi:CDP-diacylglycerol--glycerol-3-phosphate 3-phosphatidyltransferase
MSLSDFLRVTFKGILDPIASFLNRIGLYPNTVTILGLVGNVIGSIFIATGSMTIGGIIILLMGPVDALDGTMARLRGMPSQFGAFVDSVTDRYSEIIILGGVFIFFMQKQDWLSCLMVYLAVSGSVLVSYVKARAEGVGFKANVGILTRVERYLVLAPCLVISQPQIAIWIIAILANLTALQRIWHVRHQAYAALNQPKS